MPCPTSGILNTVKVYYTYQLLNQQTHLLIHLHWRPSIKNIQFFDTPYVCIFWPFIGKVKHKFQHLPDHPTPSAAYILYGQLLWTIIDNTCFRNIPLLVHVKTTHQWVFLQYCKLKT